MQALPKQPCSATAPAKPNHVTAALRRMWRWAGGMQHASSPFIESTAPKILQNQIQIFILLQKNINFNRTNNYGLCIAHKSANMKYIQMTRAGYRSKIFDIDTLSSIQVPERHFFRYQFYEISFNKIYIISKIFGFIFFSLLTFI